MQIVFASYMQSQLVSLEAQCRNTGSPCSSGGCNITVYYPNGTRAVSNGIMSDAGNNTFNYTFAGTDNLGEYSQIVTCCDNSDCNTVESLFTITYAGEEPPGSLTIIIASGIMAVLLMVVAYMVEGKELYILKVILTLSALLLVLLVIPSALINVNFSMTLWKYGGNIMYLIGIMLSLYIVYKLFILAKEAVFGKKENG